MQRPTRTFLPIKSKNQTFVFKKKYALIDTIDKDPTNTLKDPTNTSVCKVYTRITNSMANAFDNYKIEHGIWEESEYGKINWKNKIEHGNKRVTNAEKKTKQDKQT